MLHDNNNLVNITGAFVAGLMVTLLGFAIMALVYVAVPADNQNALLVVIGALATNVTSIVSFYYGASAANRVKDITISTLATTSAKAQDALTPTPDKVVPLAPGESTTIKADP